MPIKVQSDLPAKEILINENIFVMDELRAIHQDIRPLEVLILNNMPVKQDTELQLLRALSNTPRDRYADGRLDDILYEVLIHQRVLYLQFSVTVPAGGSVTVDCTLWKEPSYDFHCSGSENAGLQGYDLVTRLGSSLDFTRQTAALENTEGIEIVRQNLGFDLENGVTSVELSTEEHYYLEVRVRE